MNAKRKGSRNEHRAIRILEAAGYVCTRAAASLGVFDVIAIGRQGMRLIRVKSNRNASPLGRGQIALFQTPPAARKRYGPSMTTPERRQSGRFPDASKRGVVIYGPCGDRSTWGILDDVLNTVARQMPRTCTICNHPDRAEIDKTLLAGEPLRKIAKRTETSITSLSRHRDEHIPTALAVAKQAAEVDYGDDLFAHVKDLNDRAMRILADAESAGDPRIALAAIREARGNSELLLKMIIAAEAAKSREDDAAKAASLRSIIDLLNSHNQAEIRLGLRLKCAACGQWVPKPVQGSEPPKPSPP